MKVSLAVMFLILKHTGPTNMIYIMADIEN